MNHPTQDQLEDAITDNKNWIAAIESTIADRDLPTETINTMLDKIATHLEEMQDLLQAVHDSRFPKPTPFNL